MQLAVELLLAAPAVDAREEERSGGDNGAAADPGAAGEGETKKLEQLAAFPALRITLRKTTPATTAGGDGCSDVDALQPVEGGSSESKPGGNDGSTTAAPEDDGEKQGVTTAPAAAATGTSGAVLPPSSSSGPEAEAAAELSALLGEGALVEPGSALRDVLQQAIAEEQAAAAAGPKREARISTGPRRVPYLLMLGDAGAALPSGPRKIPSSVIGSVDDDATSELTSAGGGEPPAPAPPRRKSTRKSRRLPRPSSAASLTAAAAAEQAESRALSRLLNSCDKKAAAAADQQLPPRLIRTHQDARLEKTLDALGKGVRMDGEEADLRRTYFNYAVVSVVCTVFFMWTAVSTSTLQLFSCIHVDSRSPGSPYLAQFLVHDMTQRRGNSAPAAQPRSDARVDVCAWASGRFLSFLTGNLIGVRRCFEGAHLWYMIGVGIPGMALVCVAVPLWIVVARSLILAVFSTHAGRVQSTTHCLKPA